MYRSLIHFFSLSYEMVFVFLHAVIDSDSHLFTLYFTFARSPTLLSSISYEFKEKFYKKIIQQQQQQSNLIINIIAIFVVIWKYYWPLYAFGIFIIIIFSFFFIQLILSLLFFLSSYFTYNFDFVLVDCLNIYLNKTQFILKIK